MKNGKPVKNKKVLWVIQTVLLIALAVLAQLLSKYIPSVKIGQFKLSELVTGTVINFVLILGAYLPGFASAGIVAVISPMLASLPEIMSGHFARAENLRMLPVFIAGNITIVFITWLCFRASQGLGNTSAAVLNLIGVAAGAALKAAAMWAVTVKIIVPLFHIQAAVEAALVTAVTRPQVVTGVAGGVIALLVMPAVKKLRKKKR